MRVDHTHRHRVFIVTDEDDDIDCPLFRVMQDWLRVEYKFDPKKAHEAAQKFMTDFWLIDDRGGIRALTRKTPVE